MPTVCFSDIGLEAFAELGESILEIAQRAGAPEGSHCGGVCACSKCHIYVEAPPGMVSAMQEDEQDMLELAARELKPNSRLGCQTRLTAEGRCEVTISEESFLAYLDDHPKERAEMVARRRRFSGSASRVPAEPPTRDE